MTSQIEIDGLMLQLYMLQVGGFAGKQTNNAHDSSHL